MHDETNSILLTISLKNHQEKNLLSDIDVMGNYLKAI